MTNADVIRTYFDRSRDPLGKGRNDNNSLWFDGDTLFSYRTAIGKLVDGEFHLLQEKISTTTSAHQSMAARQARAVLGDVKLVASLQE